MILRRKIPVNNLCFVSGRDLALLLDSSRGFRLNCEGINGMTLKNCFILKCSPRLTQLDDRPENYLQAFSLSSLPLLFTSTILTSSFAFFLRKSRKKPPYSLQGEFTHVIVESRTSADAIVRGGRSVSYGVYLAVPKWHERRRFRLLSYKARAGTGWPYGRFESLIAKSDRFPSIGPFVVTSDGNRFCRARIAACQSSSYRGRCRENEI